jgi:hypothetical protein
LNPANQLTSFDPGNVPGGLFWTVAIPRDSARVELGAGAASMQLNNLATKDFHDLVNDLQHGPSVPATVSFDVHWSGLTESVTVRDATNRFVEMLRQSTETGAATLEWSASEANLSFASDPAATSVSAFAAVGRERNGAFFHSGGDS